MAFSKNLAGVSIHGEGLSDNDVLNIEKAIGIIFPSDYKEFLKTANGCEGMFNGKNYAILWSGGDLLRYNKEYQVDEFLEGMLLIGSDGGGEAFAFDKVNEMAIVHVPFVGMERALAVKISDSFSGFLDLLCNKVLYE